MVNSRPARLMPAALLGGTAAFALLAGGPAFAALEPTKVGTAAAAKPGVTGTPPAQSTRVIEVGTNVLADERIVTTATSQTQLLFNDGSSFSVGPDSDIVIDKFVFDPATGNGEMSVSVGKGVFRFVGGKISKNSEVQVKTPTATMGIRGGIATLTVIPGQPVVGRFLFGKEMRLSQNGATQSTTRPGSVIEAPPGAPPSPPRPATPVEIRQAMSQLEAAPAPAAPGAPATASGDTGASPSAAPAAPETVAAAAVIDTKLDNSGISGSNSNSAPAASLSVASTTGAPKPPAPVPSGPVVGASAVDTSKSTQPDIPVVPRTVLSSLTGMIGRLIFGDGNTRQAFSSFNSATGNATANSTFNTGLTSFSTANTDGVTGLRTTLPSGVVDLPLMPEGLSSVSSLSTPLGTFSATVVGTTSLDFQFYNLFSASSPLTSGVIFAGRPTAPATVPTTGLGMYNLIGGAGEIPLITSGLVTNAANASVSPLYAAYGANLSSASVAQAGTQKSVSLQASMGIFGRGATQESFLVGTTGVYVTDPASNNLVLAGGVQGSVRGDGAARTTQVSSSLSSAAAGANGSAIFGAGGQYMVLTPDKIDVASGSVTRTTQQGTEQAFTSNTATGYQYVEVAQRQTTLTAAVTAPERTSRTLTGYAAALMELRTSDGTLAAQDVALNNASNAGGRSQSVSITTDAATNQVSAQIALAGVSSGSASMAFGGTSGSFINNNLFGARESTSSTATLNGASATATGLLVSSDLVPVGASVLPTGVLLCSTCTDLVWGWFLADMKNSATAEQSRVHLGTFVTGTPTAIGNLPSTGRATFAGHVIGNVRNGASRYIAIGNYSQTWDFALRSGVLQIQGFDNLNLASNLSSANGLDFAGSWARVGDASTFSLAGFSGGAAGSFFSGALGQAASAAGAFNLTRTVSGTDTYQASGTFAAGPAVQTALTGWKGRFIRDESAGNLAFTGFNNADLSITLNPGFHDAIGQGSSTGQFVSIADQWLNVPTAQGNFFVSLLAGAQPLTDYNYLSPYGSGTGSMFVNADRSFFFTGGRDSSNSGNITVAFGGLPTANAALPTSGQRAVQLVSGANTVPLAGDNLSSSQFSNIANTVVSPLFTAYSPTQTTAQAASTDARTVQMQASMLVSGQGASQQSFLVGQTGAYVTETGNETVSAVGGMRGSVRNSANGTTTRLASGVATADIGGASAVYGASGENLVLTPDQVAVNATTGSTTRTSAAGITQTSPVAAGNSYYFADYTKATTQPTVLTTATRTTRSAASNTQLNGYVGGLMEVTAANGTVTTSDLALTNRAGDPTNLVIETNAATNRMAATFDMQSSSGDYKLAFGSLTGASAGRGAFVNDQLFAARENADDSLSLFAGGSTISSRAFMVSQAAVGIDASVIPSGVQLCTSCEFMNWGWWVADLKHNNTGQTDRIHLATWVAGTLPQLSAIPLTGTASYRGQAIGDVQNGANRYVAVGSFTKAWDFSTKSGSVSISNFDNRSVSLLTSSTNGRDFTGSLNASPSGITSATLNGSFFQGGSDPVKGVGGNFTLGGTNYKAVGTFVASKNIGP